MVGDGMRSVVKKVSGAFDGISGGNLMPEIWIAVHGDLVESHANESAQVLAGFLLRIGGDVHREVDMLPDAAPSGVRTG